MFSLFFELRRGMLSPHIHLKTGRTVARINLQNFSHKTPKKFYLTPLWLLPGNFMQTCLFCGILKYPQIPR